MLEDKGAKGGRAKGRVLVGTDRKDRRFDERGWGTSCRYGNEGEEMKYQWRGYVGDEEKKAGRRTGTRWWRRSAAGDGIADRGGLCRGRMKRMWGERRSEYEMDVSDTLQGGNAL